MSEITAMVASGLISLTLTIPSIKTTLFGLRGHAGWGRIPLWRCSDNNLWLLITFITPSGESVLRAFYQKNPTWRTGWAKIIEKLKKTV